jgi:hypothetical protein
VKKNKVAHKNRLFYKTVVLHLMFVFNFIHNYIFVKKHKKLN